MKRRVIQLGGKTFVISLPIKWIEDRGIKKKDELEIIEIGEDLIIKSETAKGKEKIEVKIDEKNKKLVKNLFLILGSLGYDEVVVSFDNSRLIPYIHEIAQEYSGFALVEQTSNKCFFKIVSKEIIEEFDYLIDRCFGVTLSLAHSFTDLVKKRKFNELPSLIPLEKSNNQLTTLCQRILIKRGYKEQDKTCFVYVLLWNLEIIADFYKRSCEFLSSEKNIKLQEKTLELIDMTTLLLEKLYELSKDVTVEIFMEIFDKKEIIGLEMNEVFKKGKFEDIVIGHYLMDIATFIQDCAVAFLGISSWVKPSNNKNKRELLNKNL